MDRRFIPWILVTLLLIDSVIHRIIPRYGEGFRGNILTWIVIFVGVILLIIYFKTGTKKSREDR